MSIIVSCTCANTLLYLPHDRYATFLTLAGAVVSDPVVVTDSHGETLTADIDAVDVSSYWPSVFPSIEGKINSPYRRYL